MRALPSALIGRPGGWTAARAWLWGLALALLGALAPAWAQQTVPELRARVVDTIGLLPAGARQALESKLAAFEAEAGPQIVVLLVATTQPEDIAAYAQRVADSWKIGRREVGDGLLIVVARDDRRVRIEVAKALEGAVPDLAARQIIERQIAPAFKRGDYAAGLDAGADALMARIRGEHLPAPTPRGGGSGGGGDAGLDWEQLGLFFFVGVPVIGAVLTGVLGRKLGALATSAGTGALAWVFSTSLWIAGAAALLALVLVGVVGIGASGRRGPPGGRGGWGQGGPPVIFGGGGNGGGFSSGGGGDFGGGGASGDW